MEAQNPILGKGTGKSLRREVVSGLTREFGGRPLNWKHSKGIGTIDRGYKYQDAEVHWFENKQGWLQDQGMVVIS